MAMITTAETQKHIDECDDSVQALVRQQLHQCARAEMSKYCGCILVISDMPPARHGRMHALCWYHVEGSKHNKVNARTCRHV